MSNTLKVVTSALGYQQITSLSASAALTTPVRDANGLSARASFAIIIAEAQAVRWRDDGIAPTASVGMPLAAGVALQYDGDLQKIRFIEQVAGASLNISYYV